MIKNLIQQKSQDNYLESLLDQELYRYSTGDSWYLHEGVSGSLCLGETGLGKSSGPGAHHLNAVLTKGFGGLLPCVKSDDYSHYMKLIRKAGREKDVIYFHAGSNLSFNPIHYELFNSRRGYGEVMSVVNMLTMVIEIGKNYKSDGKGSESNDRFWINGAQRFMARCIHLLRLASEPVTIQNMRRVMLSAFKKEDVVRYTKFWAEVKQEGLSQSEKDEKWQGYTAWIERNYFLYVFERANSAELGAKDRKTMNLVGEYFMQVKPDLPEKTTNIIHETFLGSLAEPFLDGILESHFSAGGVSEELQLERTYEEGKIILVDWPPETYDLPGIMATAIMKLTFQRMMAARNIKKEIQPKPAFLWVDEYQSVVAPEYDGRFQSKARSSLCITFYTSQNLNGIIAVMGRYSAQPRAKALFSNLGLKILCANGDIETNQYGSALCGKQLVDLKSTSINQGKPGHSYSQTVLPKVPADHFNTMKAGRKHNKYIVEAILFKAGKRWKNGKNFIQAEFHQNNF